jgi:hypothetical protein
MATLLLIDDDPDLLPDQVRHVFSAPAPGRSKKERDLTSHALRFRSRIYLLVKLKAQDE